MTTITDVRTVAIPVSDQDKALAFYTETLGFEKRLDAPISDQIRWIEVAPAGAAVSLALEAAAEPTSTAAIHDTGVRFTVPSAAAEHVALRERGVTAGELLEWPGVPPMFEFADPDGNRFYVVEEAR